MFTNNTIICNNTGYGTSGSLTCNIPTFYTGNGSIFSNLVVDDTYKATSSFSMGSTPDFKGVDIFIELLMFSTIVLLFIAHPITIVLGGIIGLGASFILLFLGTSSLGSIAGVIIYYLVAGGIIIWQISRRM